MIGTITAAYSFFCFSWNAFNIACFIWRSIWSYIVYTFVSCSVSIAFLFDITTIEPLVTKAEFAGFDFFGSCWDCLGSNCEFLVGSLYEAFCCWFEELLGFPSFVAPFVLGTIIGGTSSSGTSISSASSPVSLGYWFLSFYVSLYSSSYSYLASFAAWAAATATVVAATTVTDSFGYCSSSWLIESSFSIFSFSL